MSWRSKLSAAYHIERSAARRHGLSEYLCACKRCRGATVRKFETISRHHRLHGRDPYMQYPVLSEDGKSIFEPTDEDMQEGDNYFHGVQNDSGGQNTFVWPERSHVDVAATVEDAFTRVDNLHDDMQESGSIEEDMEEEDNFEMPAHEYEELMRESSERIFEGCKMNRLEVAIVLITMCSLFSIPYAFLDELLRFLSQDLLPKSNVLPRTSYEARRMVLKLGLKHEAIHCCPDGHVLFRGVHKDLVTCPHTGCGKSRYIAGSTSVPSKVLRYFPIIDQLRRMFRCPQIAEMMTFHEKNKSEDGFMRSVVDEEEWKEINEKYLDFASVPTNLRIGLIGDGVNPYGNQSSKHSVWPFLIAIYNLPPWMTSKKFFLKLVLLIPGPKAPSADCIDIFLQPLVEDLLTLWEGVPAMDMSKPIGRRRFNLRVMLIWLVHDFPAYGLLSGQQVKGYKGCPVCGEDTCAEHSSILKKMVYLGARRFLDMDHVFRNARRAFNGQPERAPTPERRSGQQIFACALEREQYLNEGGVEDSKDDPVRKHGVKRVSAFFILPYWSSLLCRHTLDVMHCEKNICETLLKFLSGENDTPTVRLDLEERSLREHLWLKETCPGSNKFVMPNAEYVLSDADRAEFMETLKNIKTPSGYVSSLRDKVEKGKLRGLKSHDFHVIMQQILPVCVRNIENQELAAAIVRLSRVFQKICEKAVKMDSKYELLRDVAETMVLLEKQLPPSAFTIMMHLPIHIVHELYICGPVQNRWMYPYERYYKGLKSYVRNLAKPEGSIAASYELEEAAGYVTEYMLNYTSTSARVWDSQEEPIMFDEILEGRGMTRELTDERRDLFHNFVVDTSGDLEEYRLRYEEVKANIMEQRRVWRRAHPQRIGRRAVPFPEYLSEIISFPKWLEDYVSSAEEAGVEVPDIVKDISVPPKFMCKKFKSMWAFGCHYRVASSERALRTLDSGVAATFRRPWRSSARDLNFVEADVEYVGELQEIIELDYRRSCIVVFVCRWVKANYRGPNASVRRDKWGFTLANFEKCERFGKESFAFPKHCQQIFFSEAFECPSWRVVLRRDVRGRRVQNLSEELQNSEVFDSGSLNDYEGLRPPQTISEELPQQSILGREISGEHIWQQSVPEEDFFDRDIGESSESN